MDTLSSPVNTARADAKLDHRLDGLPHGDQLEYIRAHRADFVGHLLIGVLSTGVYCLPSCTARQPKAENVRFFKTEAAAQTAGLRPCRRCRPDYFYRDYDPDVESLNTLVATIQRDPAAFSGLEAMSAASGIGATKLHALFRLHYQTTPAAFLSRSRLATACELLTDPQRQVVEVAYAAGYESMSAFHDNFRKATGLSPKEYQCLDQASGFTIVLPDNYLPWVVLKLLGRDPASPIERVYGNREAKALSIGSKGVLLHMEWLEQSVSSVRCRVESETSLDAADMQAIHAVAIRMLGLSMNPAGFERLVTDDPALARLIEGRRGLRIPLSADIFEGVTWAIVGQQVNLAFAYQLRRSLAQLCGQPITSSNGKSFIAHPTPAAIANLDYADLTPHKFSRRKAEYLIDVARRIVSGGLIIDPLAATSQTEKQLLAVRGLGPWSVNYIMMRTLGCADCVPFGDTGLTSALQRFFGLDHRPDVRETAELMKSFAPYRSLATYHLWMSLGVNPE